MCSIDYDQLLHWLYSQEVVRPNAEDNGTLSGHAAGEPFEKLVYHHLKELYPRNIFKQFEYLNDLYRNNPQCITVEDRISLFHSPVALFLLSRGIRQPKIGILGIYLRRNRMIRPIYCSITTAILNCWMSRPATCRSPHRLPISFRHIR